MNDANPRIEAIQRDPHVTGVTKVVDRIPRPEMEGRLEQSIRDLIAAASRFPGYLGVNVTRPSLPAYPGFRLVYRFDTPGHMLAWEESEEQHRLVRIADGYTQGTARRRVLSCLDVWFTLPASPASHVPPRGRMTVVTWLGIFPLVYFYSLVLPLVLPAGLPPVLTIALNTALVVPTMSYLLAPRLTRLFKGWLYPENTESCAHERSS